MFSHKKKKIHIFLDGVKRKNLKKKNINIADGLTYNPSLFRKLKVKNYLSEIKEISKIYKTKPLSFEIIADDEKNGLEQAKKISNFGKNIYVKIPICFTNGKSTLNLIEKSLNESIKLNLTAIMSYEQVKEILNTVKDTNTIMSVFAGRIYDIGINAKKEMKKINDLVHNFSKCKTLWASPRMPYDVFTAIETGTDIITVPIEFIDKFKKFGINQKKYSIETVKMFFLDAKKSKYKI